MNYLTYPTKVMNITQNYFDSYSHKPHTYGTPADYPIDEACGDSGRDYFYCPCDEMQIAHIYGVKNGGTNTIWLESTSKVIMPYGEDYITILVTHPEDDDLSKLKEGQKFTRGQAMFREGQDGNATGNHFHIAVGTGKFNGAGWIKNNKNAWVHSTTGKQIKPEEAFFIDPNFTTIIKKTGDIKFQKIPTINTQYQNQELYRVRRSWNDIQSQVGAYRDIENAKIQRDRLGDDYYVYDSQGNQIYPIKNSENFSAFKQYIVKITAVGLYIWKAPNKDNGHHGMVYKNQAFTIVDEQNGFGKLKSGAGWIDLTYTKRI